MTVELPYFLPSSKRKETIEVKAIPVEEIIPEELRAEPQDRDFLNSHIQIIHVK